MWTIPFRPEIAGIPINVHLLLEYLSFFVAYRYYVYLRSHSNDPIPSTNRLSIIIGAAVGALLGSRIIGILENPPLVQAASLYQLYNAKTIMGGLFGGLLGVEIAKKIIGESHSSGDLFTLPIVAGIFIGRIGCFLSGTDEFTYGSETEFFTGMDLGDGLRRHPIMLYELVYLSLLFILLYRLFKNGSLERGMLFKIFMLAYFGFRFFVEFLKPNEFVVAGLSTIQWLCIVCFVYYHRTLTAPLRAN